MTARRLRKPSSVESQEPSPTIVGKRKRYTSLACDECKRRKVRCNGQVPCQRCMHNPSACIYVSTRGSLAQRQERDFKMLNDKMEKMQEQIDRLSSRTNMIMSTSSGETALASIPSENMRFQMESRLSNRDMLSQSSPSSSRRPDFMGPTSSTYLFGVAADSLERAGIHTNISAAPDREVGITASVSVPQETSRRTHCRNNPLLKLTRNEALRLIDLYEDECGSLYPFVDKLLVCRAAHYVYEHAASSVSSLPSTQIEENKLSDGVVDILKLVIAIALVLEGQGPGNLSSELLESVEAGFHARLCGAKVDIIEIQAWTAMSILQFHCDEEVLAWRTIGLAGRAAVELGLHRREVYTTIFRNNYQRLWANKLFWCIYILDRRWSFGTGRSFAIPDHDIDPDLPEPSVDNSSYLLGVMVSYAHIGSKVWKATSKVTRRATREKLSFLGFQVRQWYDSITPELQLRSKDENMLDDHSRTQNRIRILLYLSANQMRLFIFRRTLLSAKTISEDVTNANQAVDAAKDNIRLLERVNRTADIYSANQTAFNYFLVSALAILLLSVCHAPSQFNIPCEEEFSMAVDLVRGFSCKSFIGKKLWKKIQHLKEIGPKLGILPGERQAERQQSNSIQQQTLREIQASASDNDFSHQYSAHEQYFCQTSALPPFDEPLDPDLLTDELTTLFATIQPGHTSSLETIMDPVEYGIADHEATEGFSRSFLDFM